MAEREVPWSETVEFKNNDILHYCVVAYACDSPLTDSVVVTLSGLVTLNDMKAKQEALVKEREKQLAKKEQSKELQLWVTGLLLLTQ